MAEIAKHPPKNFSWREQTASAVIFALAALILAPTLWYGLACSHDGLIHFYRIVHMADNASKGAPFLQWGEHFMRGYGYPIYAFYAPLTYWAGTGFNFTGLAFSPAFRLLIWLIFFVAGWGGFQLGRRYFHPHAAFVAGLAYLFAPYFILDAIQRGAVPETLGLALLPWALAAADVALARRSHRAIGVAAVLFALVALSHNIIPNFGFLILLFLAASDAQSWTNPRLFWQSVRPAVLIVILSLGLSAFFWLPALIELDNTAARNPVAGVSHWWPHYEGDFLLVDSLVGWPEEPADMALTNPPFNRRLGPGQFVLTFAGLLLLTGYKQPRRRILAAWGIILLVSLFLTLSISRPLWLFLPLPDFVQLPSRFLGPASLAMAVLAGIPVDWLSRRWDSKPGVTRWLLGLAVAAAAAVVTVSGWPWLYPTTCEPGADTTTPTALANEALWSDEGLLYRCAGECLGEGLPGWIETLPALDGVYPQYTTENGVNRLALPETAVLLEWQHSPGRDEYRLQLPTAQTVTYQAFYFPGWRAWINGETAVLGARPGDGLIQFILPAGESTLLIRFGPTPLRWLALFISVGTVVGLVWWARKPDPVCSQEAVPVRSTFWLWLAILLALSAGRLLVDRIDSPIRADRLQNGRLTGVDVPANINFGNEFMHLGYSGPEEVSADEQFVFTQYWRALREIGAAYEFRMQIADDEGVVWNLPYSRPVEYQFLPGKPGWQVDHYARDTYQFELLPGTPPGDYWVETFVFRKDVDHSLIPQGAPIAANPSIARIGRLRVTPGEWQVDEDNAAVNTFSPTNVGVPGLLLQGWTAAEIVWRSGETAELDLLWSGRDWQNKAVVGGAVSLTDENGRDVVSHTFDIGGRYPTEMWRSEELVRQRVSWRLPASLDGGEYTVWLSAGEQAVELGRWQIDAPPRIFEQPEVDITSDFAVDFGKLTGYSLAETATSAGSGQATSAGSGQVVSPGQALELELVWQSTAETPISYRVFVHLLDENGRLVAQSDAIPDNWTRPTTGWMPGEYIRDRHTLTLPADAAPGDYTLVVGFYETAAGSRLGEAEIGRVIVSGG